MAIEVRRYAPQAAASYKSLQLEAEFIYETCSKRMSV
jgi:hypothetical protein